MSGQDPTGLDVQGLERRIAELERQSAELQAAIEGAARVRRGLTLAVLAVLVVIGFMGYSLVTQFLSPKNLDRLTAAIQRSAVKNEKTVMTEAEKLVNKTWRPVTIALETQFQKDLPAFMRLLGTERDNLALNLRSSFESRVETQYRRAIAEHRKILEDEFPSIQDPDAMGNMIHNLELSFEPLIKRYYGGKIAAEFQVMYQLYDDFPMDSSNRDKDELAQELYHLLFELMQMKLAGASQAEDTGGAPSRAGGA